MDLRLAGKKAIVTGGTRGIGRAIVEAFANEGCHVGFCARDALAVRALVVALTAQGVAATGREVDVSDTKALSSWIDAAGSELGGLDIVVANVSGFGAMPTDEHWQRSFEIDMMGTIHTVEAALPWLQQSEAGAVVVIGSMYALESPVDVMSRGRPSPYMVMKAALTNYVGLLSSELAPQGIRVNVVSPGAIYVAGGIWERTERERPEVFQQMQAHCRMGRFGRPEEVAQPVVFLASPAASYITGTNLMIDGATTRRIQF